MFFFVVVVTVVVVTRRKKQPLEIYVAKREDNIIEFIEYFNEWNWIYKRIWPSLTSFEIRLVYLFIYFFYFLSRILDRFWEEICLQSVVNKFRIKMRFLMMQRSKIMEMEHVCSVRISHFNWIDHKNYLANKSSV